MAVLRLVGSVGAGGVLYLTPMVFHQEAFSATNVTQGLALAALAGTVGRFLCGLLLDRGLNCSLPVLLAALLSLGADATLFNAREFPGYLLGQLMLGIAMGFYWPAIELAVPLSCARGPAPIPSARGFALVRSADATGIAAGALLGAALAALGRLRGVYLLDILCLSAMVVLLLLRPLPDPHRRQASAEARRWGPWLRELLPVLAIALLATSLPALMQSALPLDLVRGGLRRGALPDSLGALLIGLQLGLLVLIQWPLGQALARRPVAVGLGLSLVSFAFGTALLSFSALLVGGVWVVVLAQLPLAMGQAAFLPIATEAVIEISPEEHQGVAMALFSQCFAISALIAPLLAGMALEGQGHGASLWLVMAALCVAGLLLVRRIRPRNRQGGDQLRSA
ncbi:MFS transporter [Cyanobium sp. ATX 6A2]|uniref:MFS transporter n=1 Tax=Cyanobium sp. ATX 6A2 TaxID=2823700 RepID=UPI0020CCF412|nr:MFS transporter [Cyanobium sp. ATX 6A2]MCP9886553.1 MFS transporter [Cyanobium sp. ATX 6A2]